MTSSQVLDALLQRVTLHVAHLGDADEPRPARPGAGDDFGWAIEAGAALAGELLGLMAEARHEPIGLTWQRVATSISEQRTRGAGS